MQSDANAAQKHSERLVETALGITSAGICASRCDLRLRPKSARATSPRSTSVQGELGEFTPQAEAQRTFRQLQSEAHKDLARSIEPPAGHIEAEHEQTANGRH